ncbi:galactosyltransferase-related protein [Helicobacter sp. MIT 05-5294]|uniref:capsular polysaccharide export protein, LipB/KpsS family n=1 Tax=Helicobacter sp. MIT 05-5294 TaxID=1548150 RepID=UPI0010FEFB04|nr:galactosyltransferase-related protein [Helicobacter sp. MIT 05-5294]TLD85652.1 capsular biosynthesis protein [Helicobacter sp. MIT 05-5294]
MPILSIIIPFGLSKEREFIAQRVLEKAKEYKSEGKVRYLFVEGYSSVSLEESLEIAHFMESCGHIYLKDAKGQECGVFCPSSCRNYGARFVTTPTLMVLDVDCVLSPQMLEKILKMIEAKRIVENPASFLVLPCVFLSESGTQRFLKHEICEEQIIHQLNLNQNKENIEWFMPTSSSIVLNTYTFWELGGYNEDFLGYGCEDFEFLSRLLKSYAVFEILPKELEYFARNWKFGAFKGFRAWYAIVGLEAMMYGIYLYHLWHTKPNQNNYFGTHRNNKENFIRILRKGNKLDTLIRAQAKEKVCILDSEKSYAYNALRKPCVFLGEPIAASEKIFFDDEEFNEKRFLEFRDKHNITLYLLFNPYAREKINKIYHFMREEGIAFYVFERGAFPNAWFFDNSGFLGDSSNYNENLWNHAINAQQRDRALEYIENVLYSNEFLEEKNQNFGEAELRRILGVRKCRVVFVSLQVESDTAILYFSPFFSYEGFLESLEELAKEYHKDNVVFVCKRHPLSAKINKKAYPHLIFAPDDCSIVALLNIAQACVLLNSGVGMYAMIAKKPAILCARAFYAFDGLNLQAQSKEELKARLDAVMYHGFEVDEEKMLRFICYLKEEFYSYLVPETKLIKRADNSYFRRTYEFHFYQMILGGHKCLLAKEFKKQNYTLDSLCYLPFAYEINLDKESFLREHSSRWSWDSLMFVKNFRIYRRIAKLLRDPNAFFLDSKNPLFYPIKAHLKAKL